MDVEVDSLPTTDPLFRQSATAACAQQPTNESCDLFIWQNKTETMVKLFVTKLIFAAKFRNRYKVNDCQNLVSDGNLLKCNANVQALKCSLITS